MRRASVLFFFIDFSLVFVSILCLLHLNRGNLSGSANLSMDANLSSHQCWNTFAFKSPFFFRAYHLTNIPLSGPHQRCWLFPFLRFSFSSPSVRRVSYCRMSTEVSATSSSSFSSEFQAACLSPLPFSHGHASPIPLFFWCLETVGPFTIPFFYTSLSPTFPPAGVL